MRALPAALLLLAALAPAAGGQTSAGDDGCTSRAPCAFVVELVPEGFWLIQDVACDHDGGTLSCERFGQPVTRYDVTVGEWYRLEVEVNDFYNDTTPPHTVTLEGHENAAATAQDDDVGTSQPFQFDTLGSYKLREQPSGDEFEIRVIDEDTSSATGDGGDGAGDEEEGAPGPGLALLALAVVAAAAFGRRRA